MDQAIIITEEQHETFCQYKWYHMFSWLAFGKGFSSFDMAESARVLTHIPYNLHKIEFLPFRDFCHMDMTTKMVAKFSNYLWLGPILYTGKWKIFRELWKAVISSATESKTKRST